MQPRTLLTQKSESTNYPAPANPRLSSLPIHPAKHNTIINTMEDDFAQSRGADDLFADDFEAPENPNTYVQPEPAPKPTPQQSQPEERPKLSAENVERHTQAQFEQQIYDQQAQYNNQRGGGRRGGRGNGYNNYNGQNGRRNNNQHRQNRGLADSQYADPPAPAPINNAPVAPAPASSSNDAQAARLERVDNTIAAIAHPAPGTQSHKVPAVKGDRTATGPPKPARRTEAELDELMAKMKIKNSAAAEAHNKSQKDQAAYEERERVAEEKRVKERQNVKAMDMERAKNAARKSRAMGGREWDSEKVESDIVDRSRGNSSMYRKGANGAINSGPTDGMLRDELPQRNFDGGFLDGASQRGRGRGRGGRGGGRGRGDLFPNGPGRNNVNNQYNGPNNNRTDNPRRGRGGGGMAASRFADKDIEFPALGKAPPTVKQASEWGPAAAPQKKSAEAGGDLGDISASAPQTSEREMKKAEAEFKKATEDAKGKTWADEAADPDTW